MLQIELELRSFKPELGPCLSRWTAAKITRAEHRDERGQDCVSRLSLSSRIDPYDRRSKTRSGAPMKPRGMTTADVLGYVDCRSNRSDARLWNSEVMKESQTDLFRMMS